MFQMTCVTDWSFLNPETSKDPIEPEELVYFILDIKPFRHKL